MTLFKRLKYFLLIVPVMLACVGNVIAKEEIKADIRYLYVQPGQTLHNIVSKLYPNRVKEWPRLRQDIVRINPKSFIDGKESQMKAGVRLTLPKRYTAKYKKKKVAPLYVGDVVYTRGEALAVSADKVSRSLSAGDRVFLGDKLVTGEDGFIRLHMIDNALLDLRCYSIMVIEDYALKQDDRRSIFNLIQGSLKKITGEIGKWKEDVYELRTPVAGLGVRGTEYALRVFQSKGCDGTVDTDDGMYLKVIKGLVDVHNNKVKTETVVAKGDTLYIKTPESKPVKNVVKEGVLAPVVIKKKVVAPRPKPAPEPVVFEEEESSDWGWWLIALLLLAA